MIWYWYDMTIFGWDITIWKSVIWGCKKNLNIDKVAFKVVKMKFLAIHITNQKWSFDIFTIGNVLTWSLPNILMIFCIKETWIILRHTIYCCLLLQIYPCCVWLVLFSRDTGFFWKRGALALMHVDFDIFLPCLLSWLSLSLQFREWMAWLDVTAEMFQHKSSLNL